VGNRCLNTISSQRDINTICLWLTDGLNVIFKYVCLGVVEAVYQHKADYLKTRVKSNH